MEWNGFVYFSVDEENYRAPAKQQRTGKNRRVVSLSFAFYRSYFVSSIYLSLYSNRPFYLNSSIFNCALKNKELTGITCNCWITIYPYPHWIISTNVFVILRCVAENFSILERFEIKRLPKWRMSQYVKCCVRYVRTRCICIRNQARSMHSISRLISDTSTTREYCTPTLSKNYSVSISVLWV